MLRSGEYRQQPLEPRALGRQGTKARGKVARPVHVALELTRRSARAIGDQELGPERQRLFEARRVHELKRLPNQPRDGHDAEADQDRPRQLPRQRLRGRMMMNDDLA